MALSSNVSDILDLCERVIVDRIGGVWHCFFFAVGRFVCAVIRFTCAVVLFNLVCTVTDDGDGDDEYDVDSGGADDAVDERSDLLNNESDDFLDDDDDDCVDGLNEVRCFVTVGASAFFEYSAFDKRFSTRSVIGLK